MKLSIIIPVLNEATTIGTLLARLQPLRQRGHEVIVVDGGSHDDTTTHARSFCDRCLISGKGRGIQLQAGADRATGKVLWFLHADSVVPAHADRLIFRALRRSDWGGFPVRLSGRQRLLRLVEWMMNRRSRLTGMLTGDQGVFVSRDLFRRAGGFAPLPLMEDLELSRQLKRCAKPAFAEGVLETSSRRWERAGIVRTILRMWLLRAAWAAGVPASRLAAYYD